VKIRIARQGSLFSHKCVEMFQIVSKCTDDLCENKLYRFKYKLLKVVLITSIVPGLSGSLPGKRLCVVQGLEGVGGENGSSGQNYNLKKDQRSFPHLRRLRNSR
jgi:hypothetical protein